MASVKYLQLVGNQIKVAFADNTFQYGYPTGQDVWVVAGGGGVIPPDPGDGTYVWPYNPAYISDEFGLRPDVMRWHEGTDFAGGPAGYGNPIPSIGAGVVEYTGWLNDNYGYTTIVDHGVLVGGFWDGYTCKSLSAHQPGMPPVVPGQLCIAGDWIGFIGESGGSFGAHLHLEIHCIPPGGSMINDYLNPNPNPPSNRTPVQPRDFMANYNPAGTWVY